MRYIDRVFGDDGSRTGEPGRSSFSGPVCACISTFSLIALLFLSPNRIRNQMGSRSALLEVLRSQKREGREEEE